MSRTMAVSTGLRPRTLPELEAIAKVLAEGGEARSNPWTEAQLWIAGRSGDNIPAVLRRLGVGQNAGPLVSIVICTYQRVELLKQAVASARAQRWPCEIVVVDDGSTDGTADWLASQTDLRVVSMADNGGKPAALMAGLERVRGEAVLVLDDDDHLLPNALSVLAPVLFDHDLVGVFGDAVRFGNRVRYERAGRLPPRVVRRAVLAQVPGLTGALLARTDAMRSVGFDERLQRAEDMDFFLRLSRVGFIDQVPFATLMVRSWEGTRGNASQQWSRTDVEYAERTLRFIRPVFRERWQALAGQDRDEGHAWALGLSQRGLRDEAVQELNRWPGPYSESEVWIRHRVGLSGRPFYVGRMLVVDEGDIGALAATLDRQGSLAELHVSLEVPQQPETQLWWGGRFHARATLKDFRGEWTVRLASSPEWEPLSAELPALDLPAGDGLVVTAVVRGWTLPSLERRAVPLGAEARLALCWARESNVSKRLLLLARLMEHLPDWDELNALATREMQSVIAGRRIEVA